MSQGPTKIRLLAIGFIVSLFLLCALVPQGMLDKLPLCPFHFLTGWDCPGCGLSRAFMAIFHGDFIRAIKLNAVAPVLVLWMLVYLGEHIYTLYKGYGPHWFSLSGNKIISRLFLVLFLGQWVFKSSIRAWESFH